MQGCLIPSSFDTIIARYLEDKEVCGSKVSSAQFVQEDYIPGAQCCVQGVVGITLIWESWPVVSDMAPDLSSNSRTVGQHRGVLFIRHQATKLETAGWKGEYYSQGVCRSCCWGHGRSKIHLLLPWRAICKGDCFWVWSP